MMANRDSRDHARDGERGRQEGRSEGWRDERRGRNKDFYNHDDRRETSRERGYASGEQRRRGPPTCYECGQVGHYRNQCSKLAGEGTSRPSGVRDKLPDREQLKKQVEELGTSLASVQEHLEQENRRRQERERQKQEKIRKKLREEEAKAAQAEKERKKIAKLRATEETRMQMRKEMRMEVAMAVGGLSEHIVGLTEEIQHVRRISTRKVRGKQRALSPTSLNASASSEGEASDVDEISARTGKLQISKKRKRSSEKPVGNNPPVMQQAKRTPRAAHVKPVRLAGKLQRSVKKSGKKKSGKKKTPARYTPRRGTPKTKIAVKIGTVGRAQYICENIWALSEFGADELKDICRKEDVEYENKVLATINIVEKRAIEAYGKDEEDVTDDTVEMVLPTSDDDEEAEPGADVA
ncbi:hypothetical protein CBR_g31152 [Chara braunii]|uniref:CCHC-type domain-containing protein n=1 Tax=Chara braunii TaxID=69332 RepID=A0A388LEP8_CHABU|nr:hypothetical protein CBR_g31152 [Chara braunii]|eukprot:GBG80693.1 hypothetical protein CBR_g31152 [Chara braunii]